MTKATFLKISYVYTDMQNQTIAMSLLFIEAYATLAECCSLARFSFVWYTFESTHFGSKKISITLKKKCAGKTYVSYEQQNHHA